MHHSQTHHIHRSSLRIGALITLFTSVSCSGGGGGSSNGAAAVSNIPSRSSNIALTRDDKRALVVNRDAGTLSVISVRDAHGADAFAKLAEVVVGEEPRAVVVAPDDSRAYVANTVSGDVVAVDLAGAHAYTVTKRLTVGTEPRALALSPRGTRLFVANHTQKSVWVIDTLTFNVTSTIDIDGHPSAIAVTNDGDSDESDETVLVTQFYADEIAGGPGQTFDDGKQGVVWSFPSNAGTGAVAEKIALAPIADSGFTAVRAPFCAAFNANVHSQVYCPDTTVIDPNAAVIAADPQGAFPNQLQSIVIRNGFAYVPSIAASPEPPVRFNVNVQALVHVVDVAGLAALDDRTVNLNAQIKLEASPVQPAGSFQRLFANDIVALDANRSGQRYYFVSRGGNCVIEAGLDANGAISLGAPNVVRYATGNIPTGIVVSADGKRAYTNNEVDSSISALDLLAHTTIEREVDSCTPPVPGSFAHGVLLGKLAFDTALGMPAGGNFARDIRTIDPIQFRGQASDNGWSSCASCHPDGLSDQVTWIFGTGPRQTLPLDAFFSKSSGLDQRISNWSGVMGSVTDFNNNARGVQGGIGFAGNPPPATIFQHGVTEGASEALDAMTLWVQTVRAPILPEAEDVNAALNGEALFAANCASCHGGVKWSKSQVVYDNNPTFNSDPNAGGTPLDAGVTNAGPQIVAFTEGADSIALLENVGTFNAANPLEIRGQAATQGNIALGALGYNVPSLLGVAYHAPYLHDGSAATLDQVFSRHRLGATSIDQVLTAQELSDLKTFLATIDNATTPTTSQMDSFLRALGR